MFEAHKLNPSGVAKCEFVRNIFQDSLSSLELHVPNSREAALMRTKLEEACFFANRAIALDPANQAE